MSSFAQLKRNSSSNIDRLTKAVEQMNNTQKEDRSNYWRPEVDKAGNGFAIIRFLPAPPQDGEDGLPWVKYYDHGFQGPTGLWYIEKSLNTLGQDDYIGEVNRQLWATKIKANQDIATKQKRRTHYVSNIYVIKDPKNPENEGKVFLYEYGKKIFEKLMRSLKPEFEDEVKIDPFNLWSGANFKLKIRKVEGYQNYDLSEFESPSALADDETMEQIWKSEYSLTEIIDPSKFKSYDELKNHAIKVLGLNSNVNMQTQNKPKTIKPKNESIEEVFNSDLDENDEDLDYFNKLLEDE